MRDFSLVPVEHQPDFSDVSLVPVDHDPFVLDDATLQTPTSGTNVGSSTVGAHSGNEPLSNPQRQSVLAAAGDDYPTADAAAAAALQEINPTSQRKGQEYAGRIYRKWLGHGSYSYTPPREGEAFSSSPGSRPGLLLHSLGVNAGTYHTHIRGTDPVRDEEYSGGDIQWSHDEGAPAYLAAPSGTIYKYVPDPNRSSEGSISRLGSTKGSSNERHGRTPDLPGINRSR